ncbi:MAG: hypothetical protein DME91_01160 [Verrucomicrobia bacterium]|nr:MAG: hypothetical protein DME91_01160 [Verrucomicrobiota bacterium]
MPNESILIAQSKEPLYLPSKMSNQHGLIAGATGTGKTLQILADLFDSTVPSTISSAINQA